MSGLVCRKPIIFPARQVDERVIFLLVNKFGSGTKLVQELDIAINNTGTGNIKAMRRNVRNIDNASNAASGGKVPKYSNEGLRKIKMILFFFFSRTCHKILSAGFSDLKLD